MRTIALLTAVLLTRSMCVAQEKSVSGPAPSDRAGTNQPLQGASAAYARKLADKFVERRRVEALAALIPIEDWRPRIAVPPAPSSRSVFHEQWITNSYDQELAEKLRQSKVPTERGAETAVVRALVQSSGLGAQEGLGVSALLRLSKADEKLGRAGDFVWEVRITWGFDVTGLVPQRFQWNKCRLRA